MAKQLIFSISLRSDLIKRTAPVSVHGMHCSATLARSAGSLGLDARELHDLGPLCGFLGDELAEFGGRSRKHHTAKRGKARSDVRIDQSRVDFPIESVDD